MLSVYQSRMVDRAHHIWPLPRPAAVVALLGLGFALCGCAEMGDGMTSAFADPAKYDLYDCKQLEPERKALATRAAELQGLMAKPGSPKKPGAATNAMSLRQPRPTRRTHRLRMRNQCRHRAPPARSIRRSPHTRQS